MNTPVVYLVFALSMFPLYWRLTRWGQNLLLTIASLAVYTWLDWRFSLLLVSSAVVSFVCGNNMARLDARRPRRMWLAVALAVNLGLLCYMKYAGFFLGSLVALADSVGWHVPVVTGRFFLPIGISFFIFQSLTYPLDLYLGRSARTLPFGTFICFVTFLPKLFAGPIVRAEEWAGPLSRKRLFRIEDLQDGLIRFLTGYFKKAIIADNLAAYLVDPVLAGPGSFSTGVVWLAMFGYAVRIYADFSGYSNMAIGCAKVLGLPIPENFRFPYLAVSFSDFWQRWHMTMSRFFRDYVYIPLGGSRKGGMRTSVNLLATMAVCGLWHGPSWTFVVWGLLHGVFLTVNHWIDRAGCFKGKRGPIVTAAGWCCVQLLVCLAWVPFFSTGIEAGLVYAKALLGSNGLRPLPFWTPVWLCFPAFLVDHLYGRLAANRAGIEKRYITAQAVAYAFIVVLSYLFAPEKPDPFIYFQF